MARARQNETPQLVLRKITILCILKLISASSEFIPIEDVPVNVEEVSFSNKSFILYPSVCSQVKIFNKTFEKIGCSSVLSSDIPQKSSDEVLTDYEGRNIDVIEFWRKFPVVISPVNSSNEQCRKDSLSYINDLRISKMWAVKMFDASAKLPSGLLSGNANQFGDFDACVAEQRARYCLASLDIKLRETFFDSALHAHYNIRSNIRDPGHRVPRFSSIIWGVCLPKSCSGEDLEQELRHQLSGIHAEIIVHDHMCTKSNTTPKRNSFGKDLSIVYFSALLFLVTIGTFLDNKNDKSASTVKKIINAFSIKNNFKKVLSISGDNIKGVDGVRALNAFALLLAHKTMAIMYNPYINKTPMVEKLTMPWAVIGRTAILYTDSFLIVSGLLNARSLFRSLEKYGTLDFLSKLKSRIVRLLPLMTSVILFCTYILPDLGSGPQWEMVVGEHSRICKSNMWKNFLFIHNFFGFEKMCLTHTHQIGMDMQLFLATPLFVWLLWRRPRLGVAALALTSGLSAVLRYLVVYQRNISMVVYYGMPLQKFFDAAKYSYILPTHRATIYLMGVALAYFMSNKYKITLSLFNASVLWIITFGLGFFALLSPWRMGLRDYVFHPDLASLFAAFAPLIWGTFLFLGIWLADNNYGGNFGKFMSWRGFKIFSKIAYAVYLSQFPIFFYNVGTQRHADYYTPWMMFYLPEILVIFTVSLLMTLVIEMPFVQLYQDFFEKRRIDKGAEKSKYS